MTDIGIRKWEGGLRPGGAIGPKPWREVGKIGRQTSGIIFT